MTVRIVGVRVERQRKVDMLLLLRLHPNHCRHLRRPHLHVTPAAEAGAVIAGTTSKTQCVVYLLILLVSTRSQIDLKMTKKKLDGATIWETVICPAEAKTDRPLDLTYPIAGLKPL